MAKTQVADNLWFGNQADCAAADMATMVHACKHPCHKHAVGYDKNCPSDHAHYLALERGNHLYLNLVDPPVPLFKRDSFRIFADFVDRHIGAGPVLIHCNQGESRAPSLALVYLAKRLKVLPNENYAAARAAFEAQWPYKPGQGIATFLTENWTRLSPADP